MTELSPLARRVYTALRQLTTTPGYSGYAASWYIEELLGEPIGGGGVPREDGAQPLKELIQAGVIEEIPTLGCRYQITARVWLAERAALLEMIREMETALGWYTSFQNDVQNTTPEYFELCGDLNATMYLASEAESIRARAAALIQEMSDDPTDHIPVAASIANNI